MPTINAEQRVARILLVDDDPADRQLIAWAFSHAKIHYELKCLADGAEALDYIMCRGRFSGAAEHQAPDIVLLDINMPLVGGLDVLAALAKAGKTGEPPVVVLTTSSNPDDEALAKRYGAKCFWTKPFHRDEYVDIVHVVTFLWLNKLRYRHGACQGDG